MGPKLVCLQLLQLFVAESANRAKSKVDSLSYNGLIRAGGWTVKTHSTREPAKEQNSQIVIKHAKPVSRGMYTPCTGKGTEECEVWWGEGRRWAVGKVGWENGVIGFPKHALPADICTVSLGTCIPTPIKVITITSHPSSRKKEKEISS